MRTENGEAETPRADRRQQVKTESIHQKPAGAEEGWELYMAKDQTGCAETRASDSSHPADAVREEHPGCAETRTEADGTAHRSVAIITARGGSRRIPHKNIREFAGHPILYYSVRAALESRVFDEVMVSTDSAQIREIAEQCGAAVPFLRSDATAGDYATTDEVIAEVLREYARRGKQFDRFCCIYPTAPFLTPERLRTAMTMLGEAESVLPVVRFSYPPQRGFTVRNGEVVRWMPEFASARSQDLEPVYHDAGQFYACRTEAFWRDETTDVRNMVPLILPEAEVQDIDTPEDWDAAEEKYRRLHPGT